MLSASRPLAFAVVWTGLVAAQSPTLPAPLGLDEYVAVPDDNPITAAKVTLGERLFFDAALSADGRVSCASCHNPARGFTSATRVAAGVFGRKGLRNVPTILNRAYGQTFFWDGRAATLEEQVLEPFQNPREMGLALSTVTKRLQLSDSYRHEFTEVFGSAPSAAFAARALATYVRVQRVGDSRYDRYRSGDISALSPEAIRGLNLFRGRATCSSCHSGPNFTDEQFHNTGVSWGSADSGRYSVTLRSEDRGRFKTPTIRQLRLTNPYMHDGSLETLEEVIEFYDRGGTRNPWLDADIRPLGLSAEHKRELIAFLLTLSS